ncbi:GMC family oxidoreductase N-terminal domain-containing protein, partial [Streptomyces sp. L7]
LSTNAGGQGAHWTAACPRPADDERVGFIDAAEWERLIGTAENLLRVDKDAFRSPVASAIANVLGQEFGRPAAGGPQGGAAAGGGGCPTGRIAGVDRHGHGARAAAGPAAIPGVAVSNCAHARRLAGSSWRAASPVGSSCGTWRPGGHTREHADKVIVAADAIRTPQLLFASGVRPKALGRYLTEHPGSSAPSRCARTWPSRSIRTVFPMTSA